MVKLPHNDTIKQKRILNLYSVVQVEASKYQLSEYLDDKDTSSVSFVL